MRGPIPGVILLAMTLAVPVVQAQTAARADAPSLAIDLPAQPLADAIREAARLHGINILVDPQFVEGRRIDAIKAKLTPDELVTKLLAGTGLGFRYINERTIVVAPPESMPAAPTKTSETSSVPTRVLSTEGRGSITGQVIDAQTGKRLGGALLLLESTREKVVADERGDFRFNNVPAGEHNVSVSFLGYRGVTQTAMVTKGTATTVNMALAFADSEVAEVVVYGQRSARALALNLERTAENSSTVISADLLGNFTGTTLSDALRRAPGIAFQQDELTGDGTNIIVRGLTADYNQVKLNGLVLPETSGLGRSARLSNILADSVSDITISKTLLPSQDSAGTGGLVEIQTKSPLDRARRYANFSVEGTKRGTGFGEDYLASGTVSGKFGAAENFGLSASLQYREQDVSTFNYSVNASPFSFGPYLPLGPNGRPMQLSDIDPRDKFPYDGARGYYPSSINNYLNHVESDTLTTSLAAEWRWSDHTNLKFDYLRSERESTTLRRTAGVSVNPNYDLLPVPELGGELRYVLNSEGATVNTGQTASYNIGATERTDTYSLRGATRAGRWSFDATLGLARGRSRTPAFYSSSFGIPELTLDASMLQPGLVDPATGVVTTVFGSRAGKGYPLPLLSDTGYDIINSLQNTGFQQTLANYNERGESRGYNSVMSGRYEFDDSRLRYLEAGVDYRESKFSNAMADYGYFIARPDANFQYPSLADLGFAFEQVQFARVAGSGRSLRFISDESLLQHYNDLGTLTDNPYVAYSTESAGALNGKTSTKETDFAPYLQARVDIGKLELIGGARLSRVNVKAEIPNSVQLVDTNGVFDRPLYDRNLVIISGEATQTDVLPRLLANYRFNDSLILRAGYFSSVARPQIAEISGSQSIAYYQQPFYGPNGDQPALYIIVGNPALKPASTDNFDLGVEYYDDNLGALKLSFFYKRLKNLLEATRTALSSRSGFTLPDDPRFAEENLPANLYFEVTKPINNEEPATVWGFETAIERQLDFLPAVFDGLGAYLNYTYSRSAKDQPEVWSTKPIYDQNGDIVGRERLNFSYHNVAFNQSPRHSGTAGLTYSGHGFDASLFYTYQAQRRYDYGSFGLSTFNDAFDSLDLRCEYRFLLGSSDVRVFLEGANLLKSSTDANTESFYGNDSDRYYTGGYFLGGRSFTLGASTTF